MKEALKLALEALEGFYEYGYDRQECFEHITAIKAALAQPAQQEPVAWMDIDEKGSASGLRYWSEPDNRHEVALYTTPQPAPVPVVRERPSFAEWTSDHVRDSLHKLKPAQQEPVLGVVIREGLPTLLQERDIKPTDTRLYTTPPQRTWVGLTDEEIQAVAKQARSKDHAVTLTNKLLKEKNT